MRIVLCALALAVGLVSGQAFAGTRTFTGVASADTTLTPPIPNPAGSQQTSFPSYSLAWRYTLYVFTVDQTGDYTATSATSDVVNTTWILNGLFSPNSAAAPVTPLSAFIRGVLSDASQVGTFSGVNLSAGQTYTALVAYNAGSTAGSSASTFTITGPGEIIDCGSTTCAAAVPTVSEWALILMGLALAGGAAFTLQRRRPRTA